MSSPENTRRWPRHHVDVPVQISLLNGRSSRPLLALGTDLNRGGMALAAGVPLELGDLVDLEIRTPKPLRITGMVCNRTSRHFGLEFLRKASYSVRSGKRSHSLSIPIRLERLGATLRRKQRELTCLRVEIDALKAVLPLLTVD